MNNFLSCVLVRKFEVFTILSTTRTSILGERLPGSLNSSQRVSGEKHLPRSAVRRYKYYWYGVHN